MIGELTKKLEAFDLSGQVKIVSKGQVILDQIKGYRDFENKLPIDGDTLFGIASGTKMFTAIAMLKLVDEGKVTLDTKAASILKIDSAEYNPDITIKHLLTHTSGMPDYYDEDLIEDFDAFELEVPVQKLVSPMDYLPMFFDKKMNFEPGEKYKYSNGGFVYLAMLIEKLSGMSYKKCIEEFILKPLGLSRTGVHAFNGLPHNTAYGYYEQDGAWFTNIYKLPIQAGGDGGIYTTGEELYAIWKGLYDGILLSPELVNQMLAGQVLLNEELNLYYGLGVFVRISGNKKISFIVGGDAGVSFRSAYKHDSNDYLYAVSNRGDDIWDLCDELVDVQTYFLNQ
ncbi:MULTISPECIES: serine hydrolase [unclassified Fusibacter]|uniref:serine hydrolase domain-containing protein n=1 Tax=unclassified Fusibacter TaxID=2624464 RepID=UPI0010132150|nr:MULTISPECIES: serine hydrolase domain-containing protein [unclassified Fusibacter]MCK8060149.1 beta-lactamase family protein [Fusibacter sp. A2]NPE22291.1 beta-lactamase family protein [Fusibacter sp. A1]RXV61064.1 class A beta-lactamase-related serine hydrolase [Fusibacter sp. A1]